MRREQATTGGRRIIGAGRAIAVDGVGALSSECTSQDGWTALFSAARNGHHEVTGLLLDRGANTKACNKVSRPLLRRFPQCWNSPHRHGCSLRHVQEATAARTHLGLRAVVPNHCREPHLRASWHSNDRGCQPWAGVHRQGSILPERRLSSKRCMCYRHDVV